MLDRPWFATSDARGGTPRLHHIDGFISQSSRNVTLGKPIKLLAGSDILRWMEGNIQLVKIMGKKGPRQTVATVPHCRNTISSSGCGVTRARKNESSGD